MKLRVLFVAVGLAGLAGVACAAGPGEVMPAVRVRAVDVSVCTPPNGAPGHACDNYDALVRANFSAEQIRDLFGCESCSLGYLTGGHERLVQRYRMLLREYVVAHSAPNAAARVASK